MPSSGRHLDLLDGLRGMAILMVVACHSFYVNPQGPAWQLWVGDYLAGGAFGVQIFFVLSGFLISRPFFKLRLDAGTKWYPGGYGWRRFLKIAPPYYLVIALLAIYYCARYVDTDHLRVGLEWAVGIPHVWYEPLYFNGSFWSLWVEIGFYLVLPALFWLMRRWELRRTAWVIVAVLLLVPWLSRGVAWISPVNPPAYNLYLLGRFPNALTNFSFGILFAWWQVVTPPQSVRSVRYAAAGYAGCALLLLTLAVYAFMRRQGMALDRLPMEIILHLVGVSTLLMLCFVFVPECAGARFFSRPILRYLGLVSYEWFLLHQPVIDEFRLWMGSAGGSPFRYLLTIGTPVVATLLVAMVIYHFYSTPIIKWGRHRLVAPGTGRD